MPEETWRERATEFESRKPPAGIRLRIPEDVDAILADRRGLLQTLNEIKQLIHASLDRELPREVHWVEVSANLRYMDRLVRDSLKWYNPT